MLRRAVPGAVAAVVVCGALAVTGNTMTPALIGALALAWVLLTSRRRPDAGIRLTARLRAVTADCATVAALAWVCSLEALSFLPGATLRPAEHTSLAVHLAGLALVTFAGTELRDRIAARRGTALVVAGHPDDVVAALDAVTDSSCHVDAVILTEPARAPHRAALAQVDTHLGLEAAYAVLSDSPGATLLALPGTGLGAEMVRRLSWAAGAAGAEMHVATSLVGVRAARCTAHDLGDVSTVRVAHPQLTGVASVLKTWAERAAAALGLLLVSPALLVVAALVHRDSPGPVLFSQTRIGRAGAPFTMLKFRTMHTGADAAKTSLAEQDEGAGVLFKMRDDPRVTRLGRVLRKYSIDEIPQLWNVVRGEMSLVGPRPALPSEVADYGPDPLRRLAVKPGITGLWQVSGRSDLSWEESTRLDLHYVDHWSLAQDAVIMARTVGAVVGHRGAY